jgi:uncharacterized protein YecT (DUF1311 family)
MRAQPGARASFDCEAPSTELELGICADFELGQVDIRLAEASDAFVPDLRAPEQILLVGSKTDWLRSVSRICPIGVVGGIPPAVTRAVFVRHTRSAWSRCKHARGSDPNADRLSQSGAELVHPAATLRAVLLQMCGAHPILPLLHFRTAQICIRLRRHAQSHGNQQLVPNFDRMENTD